VTLEQITPEHIPLLFEGLGLPQNNHLFDYVSGFPYINNAEELSNHIFGSLRDNPSLTIYAVKACPSHLGPPSAPGIHPHTSVLGIMGYRLDPKTGTIKHDDHVSSLVLQRTYAAMEAIYLLFCHLWEGQTMAYSRVWMVCNALNVQSRHHAERLGYLYEGTFRKDNITRHGTRRDTDCLSMLDEEWPPYKRAMQSWLLATNFDADGRQIKSLQDLRALQTRCSL
jgi:hypothetical protein